MSVITIDKNNFEQEVLQSDTPVLVDFWASWCGPCRMLAPTVDAIADEFSGTVKVAKLNVDEVTEIAQRYKVASIPTLVVFENGAEKQRSVGVIPKENIEEMLK